jgi:hypothetical protein
LAAGRILCFVRRLYWLVVPAVLALYLFTRQPVVGLIDSGELAAGCHLLNILHPTGYPLYTMIGRLATLVPLGTVYDRMAVLSAVLAAGGVALSMLFLRRLGAGDLAAAVGAALVGVALPVWGVSVDVEVHALTLVLIAGLWLAVAAGDAVPVAFVAYLAGLALTNHMSALAAVAGGGVVLAAGRWREIRRRWLLLAFVFAVGLSPYLFLFLRARAGPLLAWGNPVTLERLWWHVTGRQYQIWMFSLPPGEVLANAGRGAVLLGRSLGWLGVPLAVAGFARLWRRRRAAALGLAASAALSFGYAVNYSIPDIEAYYLPALLALAGLAAVGLDAVAGRFRRWRQLAWLLPAAMVVLNFAPANRRDHHVAFDSARNLFASAEPGAVIMTEFWDLYAPALYLHHVEGERPDVRLIDKELLRRSWYFGYLRRAYPGLVENSEAELARYLRHLDEFEHGRLRNPVALQQAYVDLITSFVENNPDRPAYATFTRAQDIDARAMLPGRNWLVRGLLFELRRDSVVAGFDYERLRLRRPAHPDARTRVSLGRYLPLCRERARLLTVLGREAEAQAVLDWYRRNLGD